MHSVLQPALDCVVGAVEQVPGPAGVTFHRSSSADRARLADPAFDFMSTVPSGVRIEALTTASVLEIDVDLRRVVSPGTTSASVVDVVVDGRLLAPVTAAEETVLVIDPVTGGMDVRPGGTATLRFDLGGSTGERRVEVWLPHAASVTLRDVRVPAPAALRPAPAAGPLWVHHGSSISQCSEADRPTGTWPALVARAAGRSLLNLSLGGQCHLDQFAARRIRDTAASAISLEVGINVVNADSMRERTFVSAFHGFLDTVRDGHPETPVLVLTPVLCPAAEHHPGPTTAGPGGHLLVVDRPAGLGQGALTLTRVRELLAQQVQLRRADGDAHLHLLDGLALFGPDDVDHLPDGLHPDAEGYRRMAARFLPVAFGDGGVLC